MSTEKVSIVYDQRRAGGKPWLVRWFGEASETTRPKRYSKGFKLKKSAEKFAAEKQHEFDQGEKRDRPRHVTLERFARDWLKSKQVELRAGTLGLYKETFDRLTNYFGKCCPIESISPRNASLFIGSLQRVRKHKHNKPLTAWSKARFLRNCKSIYQVAVDWGYIRINPFKAIKAPKLETRRWHYLSPEHYKRLLEVAPDNYRKAFYALAYTAGLRFGELCSLTWQDIDFQRSEVRICSKGSTPTLPPFEVKDHEARAIPLPKHTLDILAKLHADAPVGVPYVLIDKKRYKLILEKWKQCQEEGKPWTNKHMMNNALRDFRIHARMAGVIANGQLTVHCLRKSCGQNWANHLPINVTMKLMGHSSVTTTQMFYSQVEQYHHEQAARVIQALVGEEKSETAEKNENSNAD
jgi:integrase